MYCSGTNGVRCTVVDLGTTGTFGRKRSPTSRNRVPFALTGERETNFPFQPKVRVWGYIYLYCFSHVRDGIARVAGVARNVRFLMPAWSWVRPPGSPARFVLRGGVRSLTQAGLEIPNRPTDPVAYALGVVAANRFDEPTCERVGLGSTPSLGTREREIRILVSIVYETRTNSGDIAPARFQRTKILARTTVYGTTVELKFIADKRWRCFVFNSRGASYALEKVKTITRKHHAREEVICYFIVKTSSTRFIRQCGLECYVCTQCVRISEIFRVFHRIPFGSTVENHLRKFSCRTRHRFK